MIKGYPTSAIAALILMILTSDSWSHPQTFNQPVAVAPIRPSPTEKVTKEAGKVTRETANEPTLEVKVERPTAELATPTGRKAAHNVFLDGTKLQLDNLSNQAVVAAVSLRTR